MILEVPVVTLESPLMLSALENLIASADVVQAELFDFTTTLAVPVKL
jgi:hypothetical protein